MPEEDPCTQEPCASALAAYAQALLVALDAKAGVSQACFYLRTLVPLLYMSTAAVGVLFTAWIACVPSPGCVVTAVLLVAALFVLAALLAVYRRAAGAVRRAQEDCRILAGEVQQKWFEVERHCPERCRPQRVFVTCEC